MAEYSTGIYEIRNLVNGKRYIGSAVNFHARWNKHRSMLRRGVHHSIHLQQSWDKHGEASFSFAKLLVCDPENLTLYEQIALDAYQAEFNIRRKADSCLGIKRSAESIAKFKASRAAGSGWSPSEETRAKISASLKGRRGKKHSDAARANMKAAQIARGIDHLVPLWEKKRGVPRPEAVRTLLSKAVARLNDEQVRDIRNRFAAGELQKKLGEEFGVRQSCISEIVRRISYKWVV